MDAYEQAIRETATKEAPWYVIPADNKWFTRVVVSAAVVPRIMGANAIPVKRSQLRNFTRACGARSRGPPPLFPAPPPREERPGAWRVEVGS